MEQLKTSIDKYEYDTRKTVNTQQELDDIIDTRKIPKYLIVNVNHAQMNLAKVQNDHSYICNWDYSKCTSLHISNAIHVRLHIPYKTRIYLYDCLSISLAHLQGHVKYMNNCSWCHIDTDIDMTDIINNTECFISAGAVATANNVAYNKRCSISIMNIKDARENTECLIAGCGDINGCYNNDICTFSSFYRVDIYNCSKCTFAYISKIKECANNEYCLFKGTTYNSRVKLNIHIARNNKKCTFIDVENIDTWAKNENCIN